MAVCTKRFTVRVYNLNFKTIGRGEMAMHLHMVFVLTGLWDLEIFAIIHWTKERGNYSQGVSLVHGERDRTTSMREATLTD